MNQELKKIIYSASTSREMHELIALRGIYWTTVDELKILKVKIVEFLKTDKSPTGLTLFMDKLYNPDKPWLSIYDEYIDDFISEPQFYRLYTLV